MQTKPNGVTTQVKALVRFLIALSCVITEESSFFVTITIQLVRKVPKGRLLAAHLLIYLFIFYFDLIQPNYEHLEPPVANGPGRESDSRSHLIYKFWKHSTGARNSM